MDLDESRLIQEQLRPLESGSASDDRSCDRCRQVKQRCSREVPCERCKEEGRECTRDAVLLKRGPISREEQIVHDALGITYKSFRDRLKERKRDKVNEQRAREKAIEATLRRKSPKAHAQQKQAQQAVPMQQHAAGVTQQATASTSRLPVSSGVPAPAAGAGRLHQHTSKVQAPSANIADRAQWILKRYEQSKDAPPLSAPDLQGDVAGMNAAPPWPAGLPFTQAAPAPEPHPAPRISPPGRASKRAAAPIRRTRSKDTTNDDDARSRRKPGKTSLTDRTRKIAELKERLQAIEHRRHPPMSLPTYDEAVALDSTAGADRPLP